MGFRVSRGIGKSIRDTSTKGQAYRRNSLDIACSEDQALYRVLKRLNTSGYEKTWEEIASNGLSEEEQKAHTARLKEEMQGRQMKQIAKLGPDTIIMFSLRKAHARESPKAAPNSIQ